MADPQLISVTKGETKKNITIGTGVTADNICALDFDLDAYTNKSADLRTDVLKLVEVALERIAAIN